MQVKVYREPENEHLILDENALAEYHRLTEELGIPAVKPEKVPNVYQPLNNAQVRILTALCPASVKITAYTKSTIPVEVLQTIKFAQDMEMFDWMEVWYDDKAPDPMIIGKGYQSEEDRNKGYSWRMHHTLIARWGDCAYEFVDLLELGRKRVMQNLLIDAKELKQLVDMFLAEPEVHVEKFIQTGTTIYKK
jgi:hypothetical protein